MSKAKCRLPTSRQESRVFNKFKIKNFVYRIKQSLDIIHFLKDFLMLA